MRQSRMAPRGGYRMTGIYKIENKLNGKIYIGQAVDINLRLKQHKEAMLFSSQSWYPEAREESNSLDDFDFSILQQCKVEELDELEAYWIKEYNSYINGYNKTATGSGFTFGKIFDTTTLQNLSNEDIFKIMRDLNGNSFKLFIYCYLSQTNNKIIPYSPTLFTSLLGISQRAATVCLKELEEKNYLKISKDKMIFTWTLPFK